MQMTASVLFGSAVGQPTRNTEPCVADDLLLDLSKRREKWAFQRVRLAAFFRLKLITCPLGAFSYELTGAHDASGRQAMPVRLWGYIWNSRKELWFSAHACCFRPPRKCRL